MELKSVQHSTDSASELSSNRTFMELKLRWDKPFQRQVNGSNRTFMELK